jgi:hypothetical protein
MARIKPIKEFIYSYDLVSGPDEVLGRDAVIDPIVSDQAMIHKLEVHNRAASAINCGIVKKFPSGLISIGELDASATPDYQSNLATAILAGTATQIVSTTTNDGFLAQSTKPFNVVGMNVTQADGGGSVYTMQYYDGTNYVTMPPIKAIALGSTGNVVMAFDMPHDWAAGTTDAVGGAGASLYSMKVTATTAGAAAVKIDNIWMGEFLAFQDALADNGKLTLSYDWEFPLVLEIGEGIMPFFGTAAAGNQISGTWILAD